MNLSDRLKNSGSLDYLDQILLVQVLMFLSLSIVDFERNKIVTVQIQ